MFKGVFRKSTKVTNQGRDEIFEIYEAHCKKHTHGRLMLCWNVYGKAKGYKHHVLLGSFDDEQDAECIAWQINKYINLGLDILFPRAAARMTCKSCSQKMISGKIVVPLFSC